MIPSRLKDRFLRSTAASLAFVLGASFAGAAPLPPQDMKNRHGLSDQTAHPLSGTEVLIEIEVTDNLGAQGRSQQYRVRLPQREFRNPANPMMAGLRVLLAKDANMAVPVARGLERVVIVHKEQIRDPKIYLAIKKLQSDLVEKRNDPQALNVLVGTMWDLMMRMEEDILSRAERNLRELEKALREALEKNKPLEELMRLMQEARQAMQDVIKDRKEQTTDPQERKDFEDMEKMLQEMKDFLEEMMKMDPNLVQKMIEQMQKLQQLQRNQQDSQQQQQRRQNLKQNMQSMQEKINQMRSLQQQMRELEEIIREQESLKNETETEKARRLQELKEILDELKKFSNEIGDEIEKFLSPNRGSALPSSILLAQYEHGEGVSYVPAPTVEREKATPESLRDRHREEDQKIDRHIADPEQSKDWELEYIIDELGKIREELDRLKNPNPEKNQDGQQQQQQQGGGQQQQKEKSLRDKLKEAMERRRMNDKSQNLQDRQQSLQQKLNNLLKKQGNNPSKKLKDAGDSMDGAREKLNSQEPGEAIPKQEDALKSLKEAQEEMMQQMQQMMMEGKNKNGRDPGQGQNTPLQRGKDQDYIADPLGESSNMQGINPAAGENRIRSLRETIREKIDRAQPNTPEKNYLDRIHRKLSP